MRVFFRRLSLHQQRLISMMKWGIFMNPARSGHHSEHTHTRVSFLFMLFESRTLAYERGETAGLTKRALIASHQTTHKKNKQREMTLLIQIFTQFIM